MRSSSRIFISVAETSADLYAAGLIEAARTRLPDCTFFGLTGPRSHDAGCETFHDLTAHASMLLGAIGRVPETYLMLRRLRRELRARPPRAAVLIDSPALHLRVAAMCKSLGIPVLYYVAPQTWAWAEGRVAKIRRLVDRLAVILPFEEAYFARHGITARFVGHPLFEALERRQPDERRVAEYRARGEPVVALLPGSRRQVVEEVFPGQVQIAARIAAQHPSAGFLVVAAHAAAEDMARTIAARQLRHMSGLALSRFTFDHRFHDEMLLATDLALVASGTATLETAYRATPMIVMYNHGRWAMPLINAWSTLRGRPFFLTRHFSLPNIIAGREIVPEFMPYYTSIEPIARRALDMLADAPGLERLGQALVELIAPMVRSDVSRTVAGELAALVGD